MHYQPTVAQSYSHSNSQTHSPRPDLQRAQPGLQLQHQIDQLAQLSSLTFTISVPESAGASYPYSLSPGKPLPTSKSISFVPLPTRRNCEIQGDDLNWDPNDQFSGVASSAGGSSRGGETRAGLQTSSSSGGSLRKMRDAGRAGTPENHGERALGLVLLRIH